MEPDGKSDLFEPKCLGQRAPHSSGVGGGDAVSQERGDRAAPRQEERRISLEQGRECRGGFPAAPGERAQQIPGAVRQDVTVCHCVPLSATVCHPVPPCTPVCHCVPSCATV